MTEKAFRISKISSQFAIDGTFVDGEEIESGLINKTARARHFRIRRDRS